MYTSDELYHYGVLGMKWGVRKDRNSGASSPNKKPKKSLISKKISQLKKRAKQSVKEHEKSRREKILNNPTKLYKNRKKFTKEEIDQAMKQFEWEGKLQQQSVDRLRRGQESTAKILGMMTSSIGFYNQAARVYNTYSEYKDGEDASRLPYVEPVDASKNKSKKKKK